MTQSTPPPSDSLSPQRPQGETHQISRAAGLIGAATFCSRILGFIRDIILANLFGANAAADAFYIAYRIPNFLRELFAEGSMSAAFIPVFTEYHSTRSKQEAWELASAAFTTLLTLVTIVTLLGILAAPSLILSFTLAPPCPVQASYGIAPSTPNGSRPRNTIFFPVPSSKMRRVHLDFCAYRSTFLSLTISNCTILQRQ